jgi:hypothetical protein
LNTLWSAIGAAGLPSNLIVDPTTLENIPVQRAEKIPEDDDEYHTPGQFKDLVRRDISRDRGTMRCMISWNQ